MESIKLSLHEHPLQLADSFIIYSDDWWYCDVCKRDKDPSVPTEGKFYRCTECEYDVCQMCILKLMKDSFRYCRSPTISPARYSSLSERPCSTTSGDIPRSTTSHFSEHDSLVLDKADIEVIILTALLGS